MLLVSCGPGAGTDAGSDSGGEDAASPTCDTPPPDFEAGDPEGHAEPLGAASGEARAGRLEASELPADPTGLATWDAGDFVLANDRVALIIEDTGDSHLYDPFGGRPVGVARVEGGALVDAGDFNEILFGFGGFLVETESVTVMNDGSDGEPAVVRAIGPLGRLEFAGQLLEMLVRGDFGGMRGALDYELAPGSDAVEVYLSVASDEARDVITPMLIVAFFQRYRMPLWIEGGGFASPSGAVDMLAFTDDAGASYAWVAGEGRSLAPLIDISGVLGLNEGRATAAACSVSRFHLGSMVLGGPGLPGLQEALARRRGETLRTVTGAVTEDDGSPAAGVRVHVRRADGSHFARLTPAADGTFSVAVPDEAVSFFAFREGTALAGPVEVAAAATTADLVMPPFATLVVEVSAAGTGPPRSIPARVQVIPTAGAPAVPGDLGEHVPGRGRAHVAFTTSGSVELRVDPGEHQIVVSRGYEFELDTQTVTVAAGETTTVGAELEHVVDTAGVMCADYHIHTHRSPDSPDSPVLKLMGLIADGLEIAIRSDHEWVNDFQPLIESMGLTEHAFGIGGEELTTFAWGHFGVFPLNEDRSQVNGSAVPWIGSLPPAVFDAARARPEQPAFIINHPRSGGVLGGYFAAAGLDSATGMVSRPEYWDEDFTLVEVFNDGDFERFRADVVADWFSLLNSGRRVFAVGSSDSHGIYGSPVGYPRTCLALGTDDPRDLTPNMVRDVTAAGNSTINGGLYLSVVGPGGAGPGDEVTGAGETATFEITVQAASWIDGVDRLEVIVDGATVETIPITEDDRDPTNPVIRLHATDVSVPVAASGSWVVFHAAASGDLSPVHPGRSPFAVSNPIFLER